MNIQQKTAAKYITAIEEAELAVRLAEAVMGMRRPPGLTAEQTLDGMPSGTRDEWHRAARAAMNYWRECIENMNRTN